MHDNSFDKTNHVRCFNHTLQLSAKTFLKPFNPGLGSAAPEVDEVDEDNNGKEFSAVQEDEVEEDNDDEGTANKEDDSDDETESVEDEECETLTADTVVVRETVTKVCHCLRCWRPLLT